MRGINGGNNGKRGGEMCGMRSARQIRERVACPRQPFRAEPRQKPESNQRKHIKTQTRNSARKPAGTSNAARESVIADRRCPARRRRAIHGCPRNGVEMQVNESCARVRGPARARPRHAGASRAPVSPDTRRSRSSAACNSMLHFPSSEMHFVLLRSAGSRTHGTRNEVTRWGVWGRHVRLRRAPRVTITSRVLRRS